MKLKCSRCVLMAVWTGRGLRSCTQCLAGDIDHFDEDNLTKKSNLLHICQTEEDFCVPGVWFFFHINKHFLIYVRGCPYLWHQYAHRNAKVFIDQMFRLFDRDGNGKISFRVLIVMVMILDVMVVLIMLSTLLNIPEMWHNERNCICCRAFQKTWCNEQGAKMWQSKWHFRCLDEYYWSGVCGGN